MKKETFELFLSGFLLYEMKDFNGASSNILKAIELEPQNHNLYYIMGNIYEDLGNDIKAENYFQKALELKLDYRSLFRLGMLHSRRNNFKIAIQYLKQAADLAPNTIIEEVGINNWYLVSKPSILSNLGNFYIQTSLFEEGIIKLDEAIKLAPKYSNPYLIKGLALIQLGKSNDGMKLLQMAVDLGDIKAKETLNFLNNANESISMVDRKSEVNNQLDIQLKEILRVGKELSNNKSIIAMNGGVKFRDVFKSDITNILLNNTKNDNLYLSDLIDILVDYNYNMWYAFKQNAPGMFNESYKALFTHEVVIAAQLLNVCSFNFEKIFCDVYILTENKYRHFNQKY